MYESFFGLTGPPFRLIPDPSFLFVGKGHRDAFAALRVGLAAGARVVVLTGEVGAGKTTLLQALLASVDAASTVTAHISAAHLDAETLAGRLCEALGLPRQPDPLARRDALLIALRSGPRATLLVIDEAQHLVPSALDLLETLTSSTALAPARLQICLVGQPELRILLNAAQRSGFRALIGVDRHLGPLEQAEVRLYVEHRLHRAGWTGRPEFEDAAFTEIFIFTAGNPRRVNLLCNSLLLCACLKKQERIDAPAVTWAAAAMREDSFQGAPDLLDLGSHFEHRPSLTEAFEPDTPELETATKDKAPWSCPSCGALNASSATRCSDCEAARPSLEASAEPPGETIRALEDAVRAQPEAVHVDIASAHAADGLASVTAAEPPGETNLAWEDGVTVPLDAAHVEAATSAHATDDPASVRAAEPPGDTIHALEDPVTAPPDAVHLHSATSPPAADPVSVTTSDETAHEAEAVRSDPLAGMMRHQVSAARRRRQAILASAASAAVILALIAYVVDRQGLLTGLSQNELRNIVANRTTPASPRPAVDPQRGGAGSVAPASSSAQASAPASAPDLATRARAVDSAAKAPQNADNGSGRVADEVPGAAGDAPDHAPPVTPAAAATPTPPCSGPALALGLCDADSSSTRRY